MKHFFKTSILTMITSLPLLSCEIGLGTAVDTQIPTVTIDSPSSSEVVKGDITFAGTWDDDKSIKDVRLTLKNDIDEILLDSIEAEMLPEADKKWNFAVATNASENPEEGVLKLPDGKYELKAVAHDNAGHTSGEKSVTFDVDTMAPLFVVSNPASLNQAEPTVYGRKVQIKGVISDNHNVTRLDVKVFDVDSGDEIELPVSTFTDLDMNDTSVTIAQYYFGDVESLTPAQKIRHNNYLALYGGPDSSCWNTTRNYDLVITTTDAAGNSTSRVFLDDSLSALIKQESGETGISVEDLMYIENGSYSGTLSETSVEKIRGILEGSAYRDSYDYVADAESKKFSFSVNSNASPTYKIFNYDYTEGQGNSFTAASIGSSLSVFVENGIDKAGIYPDTIRAKIYLLDSDSESDAYTQKVSDTPYVIVEGTDIFDKDGNPIGSDNTTVMESTFTFVLESSLGLKAGNLYCVEIEGQDYNENELLPAGDEKFGFAINDSTSTMLVPKLYKSSNGTFAQTGGKVFVNDSTVLTVYGNYENSISGVEELTFTLAGSPYTAEVKYASSPVTDRESIDSIEFDDYSAFDSTEIRSWMVEFQPQQAGLFSVIGQNHCQLPTSQRLTMTYKVFTLALDTIAPSITVNDLTNSYAGTAGSVYYVNNIGKTFELKGSASDPEGGSLDTIKLTLLDSHGADTGKTFVNKGANVYNWKYELDLSELHDSAIARITVTDKAGNASVKDVSILFDTTPPQAWHLNSADGRDIVFRTGDADNSTADVNSAVPSVTWNAALDTKAGTPYGSGTYGNDTTIKIRGKFSDSGSGVEKVYYRIFDEIPSAAEIENFRKNYAVSADGNFVPASSSTKRVFYKADAAGTIHWKNVDSTYEVSVSGFNGINNYLVLVAVDNVGNAAVDYRSEYYEEDGENIALSSSSTGNAFYTINIDTVAPEITPDSPATVYISPDQTGSLTISGVADDDASGVSRIILSVNSKEISSDDGSSNEYGRVQIDTSSEGFSRTHAGWTAVLDTKKIFNNTSDGNITVYVTGVDSSGSGNRKTVSVGTICLDTTPPDVRINLPAATDSSAAAVLVNGAVSIKGTAVERNSYAGQLVMYYTTNETVGKVNAVTSFTEASSASSGWRRYSSRDNQYTDIACEPSWEFADINTKLLTTQNGEKVYITAAVKDNSGNTGYAKPVVVTVDQNTDRPVIKLTNIESLSTMSADNPVWLKNTSILYFAVSDDDGSVKSFEYQIDSEGWKSASMTGGAGNITIADGMHDVKFRVKDYKDKVFTTGDTSVNSPYVSGGSDSEKYEQTIRLAIDKTVPEAANMTYSYYDSSLAVPAYSAYTGTSPLVGKNRSKIRVRFEAGDENKISSVTAKFAGITYSDALHTSVGTPVYTVKDGVAKYWSICEVTDLPVDALETGTYSLTVIITDGAGLPKEESLQIYVDNTAPEIEITDPVASEISRGDILASGGVSDKNTVSRMWYAVSVSETVSPDSGTALTTWTGTSTSNSAVSGSCSANPVYREITDFGFNWSVYFDSDLDSQSGTHANRLNKYLIDYGITTQAALDATDATQFNHTVKFYLWIKAADEVGNESEEAFLINLDPQGDRPDVTFSYPDNDGARLGGKVTIYGTATDTVGTNIGVDSVWVQMISHTHGTNTTTTYGTLGYGENLEDGVTNFVLNANDLNYMRANGYNVYNMKKYVVNGTGARWTGALGSGESYSDYAALAVYTGSAWTLDINGSSEFDLPENSTEETNPVGIRICARDLDGKFSSTKDILVQFDAEKPVFQPFTLVQYDENGNKTASRSYSKEMFVRDEWYLEGSVSDADKIGELTVSMGNSTATLIKNSAVKTGNAWTSSLSADMKTATFKYKLSTSSGVGKLTVNVNAVDGVTNGTANEQLQTLVINYDNTPPVLAETAAEGLSINSAIQQSNSWYTFSSTAKEESVNEYAQSGYAFTAFYFKRQYVQNGTSRTILYDVLQGRSDAEFDVTGISIPVLGNEAAGAADDTIVSYNGLYWFKKSITVVDGKISVIMPDTDNVRVNSLIKIGGTDYLVTAKSGTTVSINGTLPETTYTKAYVALAGIVDNTVPEGNGTQILADGYYEEPGRDDGDRMIESVSKSDKTWTWKASVCSRNIPDGPIELFYVVFDNAGNSSSSSVSGTVSNNRPRIAGFRIATDYNGDHEAEYELETYAAENQAYTSETGSKNSGVYDPDAKTWYSNSKNALSTNVFKAGSEDEPVLTVRGLTTVTPEIVGGNGSIYYSYSVTNTNSTVSPKPSLSGNNSTLVVTENGSYDYTINAVAHPVTIQLGDLITLKDTAKGIPFNFTFWDSTAGSTTFTNSQKAELKLYLAINTQDVGTPTASINPFYWESISKNSIYGSSTAKTYKDLRGHIELEADWKKTAAYTKNAAKPAAQQDSLYDGDPKVSGEIVIEGTAYDKKLIRTLTASIFGTSYNVAVYNNSGSLESAYTEANYGTNFFWFEITKQESDVSGHSVDWKLYINTAKKGVAARNATVTMTAKNFSAPSINASGTKTYTGLSGTPQYAYNAASDGISSSPASYRMDIVPYISGVETRLSGKNINTPSVYSRTASGHYPVSMTYAGNFSAAGAEKEIVRFTGFNIAGGDVIFEEGDSNNVQELEEDNSIIIPAGAVSGKVSISVSGIGSLNNLNNDDARGHYGYTVEEDGNLTDNIGKVALEGDYNTYNNYYNRIPNKTNNNRLTDDVVFDVWQFNTKAVVPQNNSALDVMMKINPDPDSGIIGFAFCDGNSRWSMSDSVYSYKSWLESSDFIQCTAFAYASDGTSYGAAAGGQSSDSQADCFKFVSSKWAPTGNVGTAAEANGLRIGFIAVDSYDNMAKDRFKSPSIASDGTYTYLAYFDLLAGEIRFMGGRDSTTNTPGSIGTLKDSFAGNKSRKTSAAERALVQVLADSDGNSLGYSGEYVAIGIAESHVVMVWYDSNSNNLEYAYSANANFVPGTGVNSNGWVYAGTLMENAGKYCALTVDKGNHIHVAAFDSSNGDLKYAYIPRYNAFANKKVCTVDSYQTVGKELTIDVAGVEYGEDETYYIPHIGYWGNTPKKPRYAYMKKPELFFSSEEDAEMDGTKLDCYTGVWECGVVPTESTVMDAKRRINVGVWKDDSGLLTESKKGTSVAAAGSGTCYGNGTPNAVLGYSISDGNVETAQMR